MSASDVAALFAAQHGVAGYDELRACGMTTARITRRVRHGEYSVVARGVVRLAAAPLTFSARAMAAQLLVRPTGYLSSFTAARIYGMRAMPETPICVTTSVHHKATLPRWIDRSYSNWHDDADVVQHHGFRLERPLSLLITLAAVCNDHRFERAAEDAWKLGLMTPDDCARHLAHVRRSGRSGVRRLERWLDKTGARRRPMQSNFEIDVLDAIRRIGLPEPQKQHPLRLRSGETIHLDLAWPAQRLAIEPGHSWWHGGELARQRDERRDNACAELGWLVVRYGEAARADLTSAAAEIARIYRTRAV